MMWSGPSASSVHEAEALEHLADIEHQRERVALAQIGPVMRGVARQHDPAARRRHAHHLHARGVAADEVQRHAGRDLGRAVMEMHAARIDVAHGREHVVDLGARGEERMRHERPVRNATSASWRWKRRLGEEVGIAGMVPVEMRQHHVGRGRGIDVDLRQRLVRRLR